MSESVWGVTPESHAITRVTVGSPPHLDPDRRCRDLDLTTKVEG